MWTEEIEDLLERIRQNSISLAESHRRKYHDLNTWHKWFRVPTITMGIVSSTLASRPFGTTERQSETGILILGCLISILSAIELYLNIHASMDLENKMSKDFYNLGVDIFKTLRLDKEHRPEKAKPASVAAYRYSCSLVSIVAGSLAEQVAAYDRYERYALPAPLPSLLARLC